MPSGPRALPNLSWCHRTSSVKEAGSNDSGRRMASNKAGKNVFSSFAKDSGSVIAQVLELDSHPVRIFTFGNACLVFTLANSDSSLNFSFALKT